MIAFHRLRMPLGFLALLLASTAGAQTKQEIDSLFVRISTPAASFPVGGRIAVDLDVTNSASTQIRVGTEPERGGPEFMIKRVGSGSPSQPQMTSYLWMRRGGKDPVENVSGGHPRSEVALRTTAFANTSIRG